MKCLPKEKKKTQGGDVIGNQKNLVVIGGTKGCEAKLRHGSKGLGGLTKGDEDVEIKGQICNFNSSFL
jgi:hypothetical protein